MPRSLTRNLLRVDGRLQYLFSAMLLMGALIASGCVPPAKTVEQNADASMKQNEQSDAAATVLSIQFTSRLKMTISVFQEGKLEELGSTPGTLKIPGDQELCVLLTAIDQNNVEDYEKELKGLQLEVMRFPASLSDADMATIQDSNLLDDVGTIDLTGCGKLQSLELKNKSHLEELFLSECVGLGNVQLRDLPNLTTLELPKQISPTRSPSGKPLASLTLVNLPKLESLDLSADWTVLHLSRVPCPPHFDLSDRECWQSISLSNMLHLERLDLSQCDLVPPGHASFHTHHDHPSKLTAVSLSNLPNLKHIDLRWCVNLPTPPTISHLPRLEYLDMSACKNALEECSLEGLPSLQSLRLVDCLNLKKVSLDDLPMFEKIDLNGSQNLLEISLSNLPEMSSFPEMDRNDCVLHEVTITHLPKMSQLNLMPVADRLSEVSLSHLPAIVSLDLRHVRDDPVISVIDMPALNTLKLPRRPARLTLKKLPALKHLHLRDSVDSDGNLMSDLPNMVFTSSASSGEAAEATHNLLSLDLSQLDSLDLSGCDTVPELVLSDAVHLTGFRPPPSITQAQFQDFAEREAFRSLEELDVSNCRHLEAIPFLHLPNLKRIKMYSTEGMTDFRVADANQLKEITISHCYNLDTIAISEAPVLEKVILNSNAHLSEFTASYLPEIKHIELPFHKELKHLSLVEMPSLHQLIFGGCQGLRTLELVNLPKVETLGQYKIENLPFLSIVTITNFSFPEKSPENGKGNALEIRDCPKLAKVLIAEIKNLDHFRVFSSDSLNHCSFSSMPHLTSVSFIECVPLPELMLQKAPNLKCLFIRDTGEYPSEVQDRFRKEFPELTVYFRVFP